MRRKCCTLIWSNLQVKWRGISNWNKHCKCTFLEFFSQDKQFSTTRTNAQNYLSPDLHFSHKGSFRWKKKIIKKKSPIPSPEPGNICRGLAALCCCMDWLRWTLTPSVSLLRTHLQLLDEDGCVQPPSCSPTAPALQAREPIPKLCPNPNHHSQPRSIQLVDPETETSLPTKGQHISCVAAEKPALQGFACRWNLAPWLGMQHLLPCPSTQGRRGRAP